MFVLRIALFLAIVLLVVVGGHVYLYRRLFRDTTGDRRIRRAGAIALALAGASLFLARSVFARFHTAWGDALAFAAWCWMGVGLYLGMSLAVFHLLRRVDGWRRRQSGEAEVSTERRQFLARAAVGGAGVVAAGFSAYGVRRAFAPPSIDEFAVRIPRLHRAFDGLRIVQVSDIHIGDVLGREFLQDMVRRCNALKPDLVAVTGDLVDGHVDRIGSTIAEIQGLRSRFGSYFITGNHEFYSGDVAWCAALEQMGLTVLRNRTVTLRDGDAQLDLVGVDDYGQREQPRGWDLDAAVAGRDPERPAVLLAHQPRAVEEGLAKGIGLQLSGHTHGGQLFPITGLVSALWTYSAGLYRVGEGHVYVHRGTGFWGPPMRIGSPPEIAAITLTV
ncbi:MAG: metallophosphoesterase [Myxococcaceae bacterium]